VNKRKGDEPIALVGEAVFVALLHPIHPGKISPVILDIETERSSARLKYTSQLAETIPNAEEIELWDPVTCGFLIRTFVEMSRFL
jgi:hypothetical protein